MANFIAMFEAQSPWSRLLRPLEHDVGVGRPPRRPVACGARGRPGRRRAGRRRDRRESRGVDLTGSARGRPASPGVGDDGWMTPGLRPAPRVVLRSPRRDACSSPCPRPPARRPSQAAPRRRRRHRCARVLRDPRRDADRRRRRPPSPARRSRSTATTARHGHRCSILVPRRSTVVDGPRARAATRAATARPCEQPWPTRTAPTCTLAGPTGGATDHGRGRRSFDAATASTSWPTTSSPRATRCRPRRRGLLRPRRRDRARPRRSRRRTGRRARVDDVRRARRRRAGRRPVLAAVKRDRLTTASAPSEGGRSGGRESIGRATGTRLPRLRATGVRRRRPPGAANSAAS